MRRASWHRWKVEVRGTSAHPLLQALVKARAFSCRHGRIGPREDATQARAPGSGSHGPPPASASPAPYGPCRSSCQRRAGQDPAKSPSLLSDWLPRKRVACAWRRFLAFNGASLRSFWRQWAQRGLGFPVLPPWLAFAAMGPGNPERAGHRERRKDRPRQSVAADGPGGSSPRSRSREGVFSLGPVAASRFSSWQEACGCGFGTSPPD